MEQVYIDFFSETNVSMHLTALLLTVKLTTTERKIYTKTTQKSNPQRN